MFFSCIGRQVDAANPIKVRPREFLQLGSNFSCKLNIFLNIVTLVRLICYKAVYPDTTIHCKEHRKLIGVHMHRVGRKIRRCVNTRIDHDLPK